MMAIGPFCALFLSIFFCPWHKNPACHVAQEVHVLNSVFFAAGVSGQDASSIGSGKPSEILYLYVFSDAPSWVLEDVLQTSSLRV